jgi:hypothetical protein
MAMHASPGGQLEPEAIVGRDGLIEQLWHVLDTQSVVLTAERRMGKTSVVKKMQAEHGPGIVPIYRDLEGIATPLEFAEVVCQDLEAYLRGQRRIAAGTRRLLKELHGVEVRGIIKFPAEAASSWKTLLISTVEDLVECRDDQIVFFWDELPLMLYNIKLSAGEEPAREILDTLRSLRHTHATLRMVFTGSIGLHHVMTGLRKAGYANDPTNDMRAVDVPPLSMADAQDLARRLLAGEHVATVDGLRVAAAIAKQADNVPFFIHHVVAELALHNGPIDAATVQAIVDRYLVEPQDPWHLRYYRERLDQYYGAEMRPLALVILDTLAGSSAPIGFDQIFNLVQAKMAAPDQERVRAALTLLERDHYVMRDESTAAYRFRLPLIERYWRKQRC